MPQVIEEKQEQKEKQERNIVVFRLNGTPFALDIKNVQEIVQQSDIVSVPGAPLSFWASST